jgi:CheY-like chemotaxis protein
MKAASKPVPDDARVGGDALRTVVYIEDDPTGIAFMQHVLADFDRVELLTAPTTEIGVEIARARRPDVIIIDLPTSGASAIKAVARLREWPETRDIPVIGLSAPARLGEACGWVGIGTCRCLQKPVKVDELLQALESYLTSQPRPPVTS